jgi:AraC-like DNA-binding protein
VRKRKFEATPQYVRETIFDLLRLSVSTRTMDQRKAETADPLFAESTISAIAYKAGFGDVSHFNRAFRRRYGETPSDVRARSRHSDRPIGVA